MQTSFPWRKLTVASALLLTMTLVSSPGLSASLQNQNFGANVAHAATPALSFPNTKSIDVMKYTKDVMTGQPSDTQINNLVATLKTLNVNYVALSVPMDPTSDYPAGSTPSPRTAEAFTQTWANAIHNAGLHVLWRGAWAGMEGIYNFPHLVGSNRIPTGSAASAASDGTSTWLGKTYQYIVKNPNFFQNGDIWAPMPERTEGIFSDSTSWISSSGAGLQANYVNFFNDLKTVSEQAFGKIGKSGVYTGLSTNNYSEVMSTWLPQSLFSNAGYVVIDYYGNNHTPSEMDSDLRKMASMEGKPVFLQEWGDYWNTSMSQTDRTNYLNQIYAVMQKLVNDGVLVGFNYWGGWANNGEGILNQNGDTFSLNYRGQLLANFFGANTSGASVTPVSSPSPSPAPAPAPTPTPSSSCPAPATNSFTGCYYNGQNFNTYITSRTDSAINFNWNDTSPVSGVNANQFSVRWQGNYDFTAGSYNFSATADDGIRVYVDNNLVIDGWKDQPATTYTANVNLTSGTHLVKVEYYQAYGGDTAEVSWAQNAVLVSNPTPAPTPAPTPTTSSSCPAPATNSFTGCYYNGQNFNSYVTSRADSAINFNWNDVSPISGVNANQFSVRWQGNYDFTAGSYTFSVTGDDGIRMYVDGNKIIDGWKDQAATTYTSTQNMTAGTHLITVEYYQAYGGDVAKASWTQNGGSSSAPAPAANAFTGSYYNGENFNTLVASRQDPSINFDWKSGSPVSGVNANQFSVRWTGTFNFTAGSHTFNMTSDDGARLYVDGQQVISDWNDHAAKTDTVNLYLTSGSHTITMEYYQAYGGDVAKLSWN